MLPSTPWLGEGGDGTRELVDEFKSKTHYRPFRPARISRVWPLNSA
jgi:hypothetical protein